MSSCLKKSKGKELSRVAETLGMDRSLDNSTAVELNCNLFNEDDDNDRIDPLSSGLRVADVDLELAVEFLVLERERERSLCAWEGVMSILATKN